MHVLIQWAARGGARAADWMAYELDTAAAVRALPKRPLVGLNCQGIDFSGYDHLAIEPLALAGGLRITGWQDDPEDHGETRWATRWDLHPPAHDPRVGGMNTVQQRTVWATTDAAEWYGGYSADVRDWGQFTLPPVDLTRHGVWLADDVWAEHVTARSERGWREWIR